MTEIISWIVCSLLLERAIYTYSAIEEGIYTIGNIRFRQRFLSKCHVPAEKTDDPAYAVGSISSTLLE
jgi:hypothetical protein